MSVQGIPMQYPYVYGTHSSMNDQNEAALEENRESAVVTPQEKSRSYAAIVSTSAERVSSVVHFIRSSKSIKKLCGTSRRPIGKLGEKWQFPTDHLPVTTLVDGYRFVSLNVLNSAFVEKWVMKLDSQGLKGSQISKLHRSSEEQPELMIRDVEMRRLVLSMIHDERYENQIIALQECSTPFINGLQSMLPAHMGMVTTYEAETLDQCVLIYNTEYFELTKKRVLPIFAERPEKAVLEITFKDVVFGRSYIVSNVHMPGDPLLPAKDQLMDYMFRELKQEPFDQEQVRIVLGDMNFEGEELDVVSNRYAQIYGHKVNPFARETPYRTNIGPDFSGIYDPIEQRWPRCAKAVDHFFVTSDCETMREKVYPSAVFTEEYREQFLNALQLLAEE